MTSTNWPDFIAEHKPDMRSCAIHTGSRHFYDFVSACIYSHEEKRHAELRRFTVSIVLAGKGEYQDESGLNINLKPGTVLERAPGKKFIINRTAVDGHYLEAMLNITYNTYRSLVDLGLLKQTTRHYELEINRNLINKIFSTIELLDESSEYAALEWLPHFIDLIKFLHQYERNASSDWKTQLVNQIIELMRQNQGEIENLSELASNFNLSSRYLRQIFQEITGESPKTYSLKLKFEAACRLLASNQLSIKEIAFELGYANPQGFCRQFKRIMNCSPLDYRKNNLSEKELN